MKAWVVGQGNPFEWCTLVHALKRGSATNITWQIYGEGEWIKYRAVRLPGLDDKPITYDLARDAGFSYEHPEFDEGNDPIGYEKFARASFVNDCPCEICRATQRPEAAP